MQIIDYDQRVPASLGPQSIALGNFDGLHRGHQALMHQAKAYARVHHLSASVLLFKQHSTEEQAQGHKRYLSSLEDKLQALDQLGMDLVFLKTFNEAFRKMSPEVFLTRVLLEDLQVRHIVCGADYTYGCGAKGKVADLMEGSRRYGFDLSLVEDVTDQDGIRISSTRIREAVRSGRVEEARAMLGAPFFMKGQVVSGARRGRLLGYPTANLKLSFPYILPADGVYLTSVTVEDGQAYYAMTNIGTNPTFERGDQIKIESHLFDYSGDLYGQKARINFLRFERADVRYPSSAALLKQMAEDERLLRTWAQEEAKAAR